MRRYTSFAEWFRDEGGWTLATTNDQAFLTAAELVAAYRAGELSPVLATRASLDAIAARNDELRAYCLVDEDRALDDAAAAETRWREGRALGALDGVPASIKDLYLTAGWPTRRGSLRVDPEQDWSLDSPIAGRLRAAGAVLLGKTTTSEFGWKGVTDNPVDGITRNPWDPTRTAGGSSGGSGAALAAGMGAVSVGTDAGGSARIPAAFCGVVGLKPTYGRIPLYPTSDLGTLGHAGPMARSVADVAALLDVLSGPDPRDPSSLPAPDGSFADAARADVRGLSAAFSPAFGRVAVEADVAAAVDAAVGRLADAGVAVELVDPELEGPLEAFDTIWAGGLAPLYDTQLGGSTEGLDPGLRDLVERGRGVTLSEFLAAWRVVKTVAITLGELLDRYDVLLTPTVPIAAFGAGHDVPPGGTARTWAEWTPFTFPLNMSQQPALSVPAGRTRDGLPIGLQIVGPRHEEGRVLAVGAALERSLASERAPWPVP